MDPTAFFSSIEFPKDLSEQGIRSCIEANIFRLYFGGMSFDEYQYAVFTRPMDEWPLGHLQDHRVSMPTALAEAMLAGEEKELAAMLTRFLCALDEPEATGMLAGALELSPDADAKLLLDLGDRHPAFFVALLRGRLDSAKTLIGKRGLRRREAERGVALMLIYYGALELQLIAARARAIARFGFGVPGSEAGLAVGGLLRGWSDVGVAIVYAKKSAAGKRPEGRTPKLIERLEAKARAVQAALKVSEAELLEALSRVLAGLLEPIISNQAHPAYEAWVATKAGNPTEHERSEDFGPEKAAGKKPKRQPVGSRLTIPALLTGYSAGQQISFASLRLERLMLDASALAAKKRVTPFDMAEFNETPFRDGADGPSLRLYFAHQAIVMQNPNAWPGRRSLFDRFDRYANNDHGQKSATAIKEARLRKTEFLQGRGVVSPWHVDKLVGPQRYDILPDYRLGVKPTLPSKPAPDRRRKRENVLPEFTQKHGLVHLPRE